MGQVYVYLFMVGLIATVYFYSKTKSSILKKIPEDAIIIDVRSPGEYNSGAIDRAINIPVADIVKNEQKILSLSDGAHDRVIVVYCASGIRSKMAQSSLKSVGFKNVINGGSYSKLSSII